MEYHKLAAPVQSIERHWELRSSRIVVDATPRVVLHVQALQDVEARALRARFHGLGQGVGESLLVVLPQVHGVRQLRPTGERWVIGRQDLAVPEGAGEALAHNHCRGDLGYDYWSFAGSIEIPRGLCVGLVARSSTPCECEVRLGGR